MKSLKELLVYGPGPSSSHTIGPYRILKDFLNRYPNRAFLDHIEITLFGSLALTGKGHSTDDILRTAVGSIPCTVLLIPR